MTEEISERILFSRQATDLARRINGHRVSARAREAFVRVGLLTYEQGLRAVSVGINGGGMVDYVSCDHPRLGFVEVVVPVELEAA